MKRPVCFGLFFVPQFSFQHFAGQFLALALCAAGVLGVSAQTAHFSGTIKTLGGGFNSPAGITVDGKGDVFVADSANNQVKEIPAGCITASCVTVLGGGFNSPLGVAVDAVGDVYVADGHNSAVKEIPTGCTSSSCVLTLGSSPSFETPEGVAVDSVGNVYVADGGNHTVKEIYANCVSSYCTITLGSGFITPTGVAVDGSENVYVADSSGTVYMLTPYCGTASCMTKLGGGFTTPIGLALDTSGHLYIADDGKGMPGNGTVKEMTTSCAAASCVTTLATNLSSPLGVAADINGNVYASDSGNNAVEEIMPRGANFGSVNVAVAVPPVLTLSFVFDTGGTLSGTPYSVLTLGAPNQDFTAAATQPSSACVAAHAYSAGNTCSVTVAFEPQFAGQRLGALVLNGASGAIATAYVYGTGTSPQVAFLPAKMTLLGGGWGIAYGVALDGNGNIYVVDNSKKQIDKMPLSCASATCVTTFVTGFTTPTGIAVDGSGAVYIADGGTSIVRKIPLGCAAISCMTTLGGGFKDPIGLTVDQTGNVYVADNGNNSIKEIAPGCAASTCVTTLGGGFSVPDGVAVDVSGNIYVADTANNVVKMMTPGCTSTTCVKTLGGGFNNPFDVAAGAGVGIVYVADGHGDAVKEMSSSCTTTSCVVTLSATGTYGYPQSLVVDGSGNVYVADRNKNTVSKLDLVDVPSLKFATATMQGGTDTTDGTETVTLQNIGNAALTFPEPSTGNNPSIVPDFTLATTSTGDCPQVSSTSSAAGSLAPGASCILPVTFTPITATGSISGTLVLTDNNLNAAATAYAVQTVSLSGTATPGTPDFALTSTGSASETVNPGQSATFTFNVAPTLGQFPGTVTYAVSGLPTGATATFNPTSITATSGVQALTLTIVTPAATATIEGGHGVFSSNLRWSLAFLLLPLVGIRRKRYAIGMLFLPLIMLTLLGSMTGCASKAPPSTSTTTTSLPPAQTSTIVVTATSGTKTHTASVTLIVE